MNYEMDISTKETILARVPILEIFRNQLVCQEWRSIIHSPTFRKAFHAVANRPPWFLMNATNGSVNCVYDTELGRWHKCDFQVPEGRIPIASSGSLMCFLSGHGTLSVSNPFTGPVSNVQGFLITKGVEVVAMRATESSFKLFVVWRNSFGLTMKIFSSTEDTWREFQLREQHLDGETEPDNGHFSKWSIYRENAGLTTVNSEGNVMVYYLNAINQLVKCDVKQCIAYVYPKLPKLLVPPSVAYSFDVVECGGRIFIVGLKEGAVSNELHPAAMVLQLYEFKHGANKWDPVAETQVLVTGSDPNLHPDIKASGSGNAILVCVAWEEYDMYQVIKYNIEDKVCEMLPPCIDRNTGKAIDFNRAFSIVPDINFNV